MVFDRASLLSTRNPLAGKSNTSRVVKILALFVFAAIDQVISPESVDQSIPEPDQARLVVDSLSEAPSPTPSELENFFLNKNEIVDIDGSSFGYVNVKASKLTHVQRLEEGSGRT